MRRTRRNLHPIWGLLIIVSAVLLLPSVIEWMDAQDAKRMRQINAEIREAEASMDRAAAALCRAELGPGAQALWTHQGDLVCRPAVLTAGGAQ
ncbi:MAG: hypothetical protein KGZ67_12990 [Hydrogenophaga sp.]|jgi:hypothetical protein|nr:hypothetical protein [Hydrogenophaga sp.]